MDFARNAAGIFPASASRLPRVSELPNWILSGSCGSHADLYTNHEPVEIWLRFASQLRPVEALDGCVDPGAEDERRRDALLGQTGDVAKEVFQRARPERGNGRPRDRVAAR
jgi:hypothetical protein